MKKLVSTLLLACMLAWGVASPNGNALAVSPTGWKLVSGNWYYYTTKGKATGWLFNGGKWYLLDSNGVMKTGWVYTGCNWYYLNSSGAMATGWANTGGKWYYLNSSGAMATGWVYTGGKWYYLNASGAMQTGWQTISGKQYYLYSSGAMAVSTTIDGKTIGSDGAVLQNSTPSNIAKANSDANTSGATVKLENGKYNIYKNNMIIGYFWIANNNNGEIRGDIQYKTLIEQMAIDLGFNATIQELDNIVNSNITGSVYNNTEALTIDFGPTEIEAQASKAVNDIQSSGAIVKRSGTFYNIFKNHEFIGQFDLNAIEGTDQYSTLFEQVAIDLGIPATSAELKSLIDYVQKESIGVPTWFGQPTVMEDSTRKLLSIVWTPQSTTTQITKALNDIKDTGAIAKPGGGYSYNIFKNNEYIGYFEVYPNNKNTDVVACTLDPTSIDMLEKISIDLGYKGTLDALKTHVQQAINGTTTSNEVLFDKNSNQLVIHISGIY